MDQLSRIPLHTASHVDECRHLLFRQRYQHCLRRQGARRGPKRNVVKDPILRQPTSSNFDFPVLFSPLQTPPHRVRWEMEANCAEFGPFYCAGPQSSRHADASCQVDTLSVVCNIDFVRRVRPLDRCGPARADAPGTSGVVRSDK